MTFDIEKTLLTHITDEEKQLTKLDVEVVHLKNDVSDLKNDVKLLLELANRSKGGFWMGMTLASMIGAFASWIVSVWPFR